MMKILILFALTLVATVAGQGCPFFNEAYKDAKSIVGERRESDKRLQEKGFFQTESEIGFRRSLFSVTCGYKNYWMGSKGKESDYLTNAARLMSERDPSADFSSFSSCMNCSVATLKKHQKYRTISGFGNNLKNPYWGMSDTPFASFGEKNYDDGVYSMRKSVTGAELPPPRQLVRNVLIKAEKTHRGKHDISMMFNLHDLYLSHDQGQQNPIEGIDNCKAIRCCSKGNKNVLDKSVSHSACIPLPINPDDDFYSKVGARCVNMLRAETASVPGSIRSGEILNRVTAYLDHSMIYANDDSEHKQIRTFVGGKLNLGPFDLLPMTADYGFTPISARLIGVPPISLFVILHGRNHNNLADALAKVNPTWNDEKLFQEARRLNIALLQRVTNQEAFPVVFGETLEGVYDPTVEVANTNEFNTAAYRFFHFNVNPNMNLLDENNNLFQIPISETFGRLDLLQNFDDFVRGAMTSPINFEQYQDEMFNKFAKNDDGIGLDVISFDIQRGRDHGLMTYLQVREKCGLKADFKTFEDLLQIFPETYADYLQRVYADVRDIDLYVGGALENFLSLDTSLVGETYKCVIKDHFVNTIKSDAYYYTHRNSPYPFTAAQIAAIETVGFNTITCQNTGVKFVPKDWSKVPHEVDNPLVPCSNYPQIDLSAWKGI